MWKFLSVLISFGVYIKAPDCWKLPCGVLLRWTAFGDVPTCENFSRTAGLVNAQYVDHLEPQRAKHSLELRNMP